MIFLFQAGVHSLSFQPKASSGEENPLGVHFSNCGPLAENKYKPLTSKALVSWRMISLDDFSPDFIIKVPKK